MEKHGKNLEKMVEEKAIEAQKEKEKADVFLYRCVPK